MLSQPGIGGCQRPQNQRGLLLLYYSTGIQVQRKKNKRTTQGE